MSRFLLFYFIVYGGVNAFAGARLWPAARRLGPWGPALLVPLLVFLFAAPLIARRLESRGLLIGGQVVGFAGYIWMAAMLWFFFMGIAVEIWNGLLWIVARWRPEARRALIPWRIALPAIWGLIALAIAWGAVEARRIRVERIAFTSPRLPAAGGPILVAQVSDLHLGMIERDGRLRQVLDILRRLEPDLLVVTGDLVDGSAEHMEKLAAMWNDWRPPLGKYAVLGNHEWYVGLDNSVGFMERSGFTVLRQATATPAAGLFLAGVDDPAGGARARVDAAAILPPAGPDRPFTLLLRHQPVIEKGTEGRFDLQLSGHTHNGQIYPFNWLVKRAYPMIRGLYRLDDGSSLYVNRGTGTWGPPLRLGSPPELTLITLEPETTGP